MADDQSVPESVQTCRRMSSCSSTSSTTSTTYSDPQLQLLSEENRLCQLLIHMSFSKILAFSQQNNQRSSECQPRTAATQKTTTSIHRNVMILHMLQRARHRYQRSLEILKANPPPTEPITQTKNDSNNFDCEIVTITLDDDDDKDNQPKKQKPIGRKRCATTRLNCTSTTASEKQRRRAKSNERQPTTLQHTTGSSTSGHPCSHNFAFTETRSSTPPVHCSS